MKSRRTISYIGLWALIMPWLGFSWETKTVLFSLTGLILLFIGNKHYHSEKRNKESGDIKDQPAVIQDEPVIIAESVKVYSDIPEYMEPVPNLDPVVKTEPVSDYNTQPEAILEEDYIEEVVKTEPVIFSNDEVKEEIIVVSPKPKQSRIRKSIEILPRFKRSSKAIPLESLDTNDENEQN